MKPESYSKTKFDLVEGAAGSLIDDLPEIQKLLVRKILAAVKKLPTSGGKLQLTDDLTAINEIAAEIVQMIQNSPYPNKIKDYLRNFDEIDELVAGLHQTVNGIAPTQLFLFLERNPAKKLMVNRVASQLAGDGLNSALVQPVKDLIAQSIITGTSLSNFEDSLRLRILGDGENLGTLERYVTQISRDALYQYDGAIQNEIKKEYGFTNYTYTSGTVEDSRPFCIHLVGKESFTEEWLIGALAEYCPGGDPSDEEYTSPLSGRKLKKGSGMIPGTNIDNVIMLRGGYNCMHELFPTG